jgi:hypothetical protein
MLREAESAGVHGAGTTVPVAEVVDVTDDVVLAVDVCETEPGDQLAEGESVTDAVAEGLPDVERVEVSVLKLDVL